MVSVISRANCGGTLSELLLRGCMISDEGVMVAVRFMPLLESLDIGAWPYSRLLGEGSVTDVSLFFIAQCAALRGESFLLKRLCVAGRR